MEYQSNSMTSCAPNYPSSLPSGQQQMPSNPMSRMTPCGTNGTPGQMNIQQNPYQDYNSQYRPFNPVHPGQGYPNYPPHDYPHQNPRFSMNPGSQSYPQQHGHNASLNQLLQTNSPNSIPPNRMPMNQPNYPRNYDNVPSPYANQQNWNPKQIPVNPPTSQQESSVGSYPFSGPRYEQYGTSGQAMPYSGGSLPSSENSFIDSTPQPTSQSSMNADNSFSNSNSQLSSQQSEPTTYSNDMNASYSNPQSNSQNQIYPGTNQFQNQHMVTEPVSPEPSIEEGETRPRSHMSESGRVSNAGSSTSGSTLAAVKTSLSEQQSYRSSPVPANISHPVQNNSGSRSNTPASSIPTGGTRSPMPQRPPSSHEIGGDPTQMNYPPASSMHPMHSQMQPGYGTPPNHRHASNRINPPQQQPGNTMPSMNHPQMQQQPQQQHSHMYPPHPSSGKPMPPYHHNYPGQPQQRPGMVPPPHGGPAGPGNHYVMPPPPGYHHSQPGMYPGYNPQQHPMYPPPSGMTQSSISGMEQYRNSPGTMAARATQPQIRQPQPMPYHGHPYGASPNLYGPPGAMPMEQSIPPTSLNGPTPAPPNLAEASLSKKDSLSDDFQQMVGQSPGGKSKSANSKSESHPATPASPSQNSISSFHDDMDGMLNSPSLSQPQRTNSNSTHSTTIHSSTLQKLCDMGNEPDRKAWVEKYFTFMDEMGQPLTTLPQVAKQPLDLYRFYLAVRERGGLMDVVKTKRWKEISQFVNINASASAAFTLRKNYVKYLFDYECRFDRGNIDPRPLVTQIESMSGKKKKKQNPPAIPGMPDQPSPGNAGGPGLPEYNMDYPSQNHPHFMQNGVPPRGYMPPPGSYTNGHHSGNMLPPRGPYGPTQSGWRPNYPGQQQQNGMMPPGPYPPGPPGPPMGPHQLPPGSHQPRYPGPPYMHGPPSSQYPGPPNQPNSGGNLQSLSHGNPPGMPPPMAPPTQTSQSNIPCSLSPNITPSSSNMYPAYQQRPTPPPAGRENSPMSSAATTVSAPSGIPTSVSPAPPPVQQTNIAFLGHQSQTSYSRKRHSSISVNISPTSGNSTNNHNQQNTTDAAAVPSKKQPESLIQMLSALPSLGNDRRPDWPPTSGMPPPSAPPPLSGSLTVSPSSVGLRSISGSMPPNGPCLNGRSGPSASHMVNQGSPGPHLLHNMPPHAIPNHLHQHEVMSRSPSQKSGYVTAVFKRLEQIYFPPNSVEATQPNLTKRKKYGYRDVCPLVPWKLYMALKSGLPAEVSWALDCLNILLRDEVTFQYFGLSHLPGLLETLLEIWRHSLSEVFETNEFGGKANENSTETTPSKSTENEKISLTKHISLEQDILERLGHMRNLNGIHGELKDLLDRNKNYPCKTRQGLPVRLEKVSKGPHARLNEHELITYLINKDVSDTAEEDFNLPETFNEMAYIQSGLQSNAPNSLKELFFSKSRISKWREDDECNADEPKSKRRCTDAIHNANEDDPNDQDTSIQVELKAKEEMCTDGESTLYHVSNYQEATAQRCVCIATVIRNLSFLNQNETAMATNKGLLSILGKLLLRGHKHCSDWPKTESDWWLPWIEQLRENALVIFANLAGYILLEPYPEDIIRPLLEGILHWLWCNSSASLDPFPRHTLLSPRRLALEILMKLCVHSENVELILATPTYSDLQKLFDNFSSMIASGDQILREMSLATCFYLVRAGEGLGAVMFAKSKPCAISAIIDFLEYTEASARHVIESYGMETLQAKPELMGTSLELVRRAGIILEIVSSFEGNLSCFTNDHQNRLLFLVMSKILDQNVAQSVAGVLYKLPTVSPTGSPATIPEIPSVLPPPLSTKST